MTVLCDPERYRASGMLYLYECGVYPPNYPVPAIPTYVTWDCCWALGQLTRMHVIWWRKLSDGTWYGTKAIAQD